MVKFIGIFNVVDFSELMKHIFKYGNIQNILPPARELNIFIFPFSS